MLILFSQLLRAQTSRHIVYLSDKNNNSFSTGKPAEFLTEKSLQRRNKQNVSIHISDLPVSNKYKDSLAQLPLKVLTSSKWLNAILVESADSLTHLIPSILEMDFVKGITKAAFYNTIATNNMQQVEEAENTYWKVMQEREYGATSFQIKQMNGDQLHSRGFTGSNMLIGIIDAGFNKVEEMFCFNHVLDENRLIATKNFLNKGTNNVYASSNHGTHVYSILAGKIEGSYYGVSPDANYLLLVTEDISSEQMVEEFNYVKALEFADSLGVDVINVSLGYFAFDEDLNNYTPDNLDGKTAISTIGSLMAARKGILVVSSAGNEGASGWKYITVPSDADSTISVAGVDNEGLKIPFSSIGYDKFKKIKPDVAALGRGVSIINNRNEIVTGSGTSYASPLVAGLAACLWQAFPDKNNQEIIQAILKSSSQYYNPDFELGFGIPDFSFAYRILEEDLLEEDSNETISVYPNPTRDFININFYENFDRANLYIYNLLGKIIYTEQLNIHGKANVSIPVMNLQLTNSGMYFIRLESINHTFTQKIYINP